MGLFDIKHIAFSVLGYELSYVELIGTVFGLVSVWLAAKSHILTWPTGIVNEAAFFLLFYQVQLYSDMYLQVYFFGVTLYGWHYWKKEDGKSQIRKLSVRWRQILLVVLLILTGLSGWYISRIHLYFPELFTQPAAYPYWDAFTTVSSIIATILLSRKIIETWVLWIAVDVVSVILYFLKGIHFVAIEYVVFLVICITGFVNWSKKQ